MRTSTTEITVETHRVVTIRRGSRRRVAWCDQCGKQAQMATASEVAILAGVSERAIFQLVEARELHFIETPEGLLLLCFNSVKEQI